MELSSRVLVQRVQVHSTVTLVAKHLDQSGPAFFGRWLQLPICHTQQMHLEGLHEKIL